MCASIPVLSMRVSEPGLTGNTIHLSVTSARTQIHAALMSLTPSAFKIQPTRRIPLHFPDPNTHSTVLGDVWIVATACFVLFTHPFESIFSAFATLIYYVWDERHFSAFVSFNRMYWLVPWYFDVSHGDYHIHSLLYHLHGMVKLF